MICFAYNGIYFVKTMMEQLINILNWYIVIQVFCIIGFVLGFKLFSSLTFHGFSISKTLGLLTYSIVAWFLCNRKFELLPYSHWSLYLILLILAGLAYYIFINNKNNIVSFCKNNCKYLLNIELAFVISFLIFTLLRTYTPNIEGTEKPLEFVVINSILNADFFPAFDVWLAHETQNYYYLGQFIFCNIIKLGFINPAIGFNLINPTILSLILIGSFEFMYELTKKVRFGLLCAFMTSLMGNLEPVVQIFKKGWVPEAFRWWDAGHIITYSFPEFPYWSFLHSDVHAHFLVHPFTILFLFIILVFIREGYYLVTIEDFKNKEKLSLNILYCFILGGFMLINSWNYPSAIALTFAAIYIHIYKHLPRSSLITNILKVFPAGFFYILLSYFLYLSFYAYFTSPVEGLGFVDSAHRTPLSKFLLLIGVFLLPVLVIVINDFIKNLLLNKDITKLNRLYICGLLLIIIILSLLLTKSIVIAITITILIYLFLALLSRNLSTDKAFLYSIAFLIFSLILTCEFIFVNDLFGKDYERQNTVAKSYIQLLLLLPIFTTYCIYLISTNNLLKGSLKRIYVVTLSVLLILSSTFLWIGTQVKNNCFERKYTELNWHIPTLDGRKYVEHKYNHEYNGIMWLRENATRKDVVLEAEGKPYSYYGRVASLSGIPALINWVGSLNVLRGKYFYLISNPRKDAINSIYNAKNKEDIVHLLRQFKITYIFVGTLERINYDKDGLNAFEDSPLFTVVFKKGNTTIYKVN